MPYYQFAAPAGELTLKYREEIAAAVTRVHVAVTGAPATYVHCSFTELPSASVYVGGEVADKARLVGIIRPGRSVEVKKRLITQLGEAWADVTGEPLADYAIWLHEVPGYQTMENGELLPEASEDEAASSS